MIEKYDKQIDGSWTLHEFKSSNDIFKINAINLEIDVKAFYKNVVL